MPIETFQLHSRRQERAKRVKTAQHVVAAIILITAAVPHLEHPVHGLALPLAELVTASGLIVTAVLEKLGKLRGRAAWLEYAGAAMTFVEAVAQTRVPHHLSFYFASFVPPLVLFLFAAFDTRIHHAIAMKADERTFSLRLRLFYARRIAWSELKGFEMLPHAIRLVRNDDGITRFELKDVINLEPAMQWAREQFERRGLQEVGVVAPEVP
jgi:hypothetical protein